MGLEYETPWADDATAPAVPQLLRTRMDGCFIGPGDFAFVTRATGTFFQSVAGIPNPSTA
jgi:hypothetical protein